MRRGLIFSALLHLGVVVLVAFGLPQLRRELPLPEPTMRVELAPIAALTNRVPPKAEPEQPAPAPKPEPPKVETPPLPKPEPEKAATPTPPKPEPAPVVAQPAPPPPAPRPPEVAALPKPEPPPVPKPEPKPEPRPAAVPPPQPSPRPEAKPQPRKENDFDSLLKSLGKPEPKPARPQEPPREPAKKSEDDLIARVLQAPSTTARPARDAPLSMTVIDSIRRQVEDRWNIPAGMRDVANMQVEIRLILAPDGSVRRAEVVDGGRMGDSAYRAFAESAQRAVLMASPLKNLPPDQYDSWKDIVLGFRPPSG